MRKHFFYKMKTLRFVFEVNCHAKKQYKINK